MERITKTKQFYSKKRILTLKDFLVDLHRFIEIVNFIRNFFNFEEMIVET